MTQGKKFRHMAFYFHLGSVSTILRPSQLLFFEKLLLHSTSKSRPDETFLMMINTEANIRKELQSGKLFMRK